MCGRAFNKAPRGCETHGSSVEIRAREIANRSQIMREVDHSSCRSSHQRTYEKRSFYVPRNGRSVALTSLSTSRVDLIRCRRFCEPEIVQSSRCQLRSYNMRIASCGKFEAMKSGIGRMFFLAAQIPVNSLLALVQNTVHPGSSCLDED